MWVPRHTATKDNDLTTELARQTADMHIIVPESFFGVLKH